MLTLTRSGLTLNLNASVVPATGSSNVPILYMEEIADDYTGYLVEPRIGFTQNGKYTEFIGTYEEESQSVIIPAQCFANTGSVDITIALIDPEDPDHVEVCTPKKFSVTKAPMGTVVLPEEPTWQDYVLNYMKQNLDKLQGPQGDKGEPGDNATINVGAVTTLEPGQEATVQNTGTETNAVLSFGIPKGPQGAPGINENVLHADISKSENPSVDDAYEAPLQNLKLYGKSTQASTSGAQKIDVSNVTDRVDTTHELTDTGLTVTGQYYVTVANVDVPPNTDMYISYVKSGSGVNQVSVYKARSVTASDRIYSSGGTGGTFNTGDNSQVDILFYSGYGSSSSSSTYNDVMLCEGTSAKPYEPYTGGAPSPSPDYPQEITKIEEVDCLITGRNIFDYQSIVDEATDAGFSTNAVLEEKEGRNCLKVDTGDANFRKLRFLKGRFKENTQYKFSITGYYEGTSTNQGLRVQLYYTDGSLKYGAFIQSNSFSNIEILSASDKTIDYISFSFGDINTGWIDLDTSYIVELSQDTGEYEPYQSQHVQFTPPAPLYSLLDGSVADYVDVARGKYVYQLADVTFDGSEDEGWGEYNSENLGYKGVLIQRLDMKVANRQSGFCDKLGIATHPGGGGVNLYSVWLGVYNNYIYIPYANTLAGTTSAAEFKTWLATNNLRFVYPLATATEQDIPAETLEALQALKTFNGVTNIFCNAPVSAQYEQSVQIVINKILEQLNKLQTQTLNLQEEMINNV